jgi:hypothetical protein
MACVGWSFYELGVSSSRSYIMYFWVTYMLCDAVGSLETEMSVAKYVDYDRRGVSSRPKLHLGIS